MKSAATATSTSTAAVHKWLRVRAGCQVARFTFLIISWFSFFARCDYENGVKRGGRLQIELCFVAGIIALLSHADVTSSPILLKIEYIYRYISFFQLVNSHFWEFFEVIILVPVSRKRNRSPKELVAMSLTVFCGRLRKQVGAH